MRWFIHMVVISFLRFLILLNAAAQDSEKGEGWERFEFNKDAPLDDEEVEGQTFFLILHFKFICGISFQCVPMNSSI